MANNNMVEEIKEKVKDLIEKLNSSDLILDEIEDWVKTIQFNLHQSFIFSIHSNGNALEFDEKNRKSPDCTVIITPALILKMVTGDLDIASYFEAINNKKIEIQGNPQDYMKFTVLLEFLEDSHIVEKRVSPSQWKIGNPEDFGMNTHLLDKVAKELKKIDINRNSFIVIRKGVLVYEEYFGRRSSEQRKWMHYGVASVTKTMAALVIGIAVTQGSFTVNDLIRDWVPDAPQGIVSGSKVIHLLTQTSETKPAGSNFKYNSGAEISTLAKILSITAKQSSKEFAKKNLFEPLGISHYSWSKALIEQPDLPIGYGMKITPRDAARLGQLILNKGKWDGQQLISEKFIEELSRPAFPETNTGYGYLSWLNNSLGHWYRPFKNGTGRMIPNAPEDLIYASGFYGRFIIVIPSLDMVIVTFGKKFVMESLDTIREIYNAIESALPSNYHVNR